MESAANRKPIPAPRRGGKQWSGGDVARLMAMAERDLSVDRIARKLGRTEAAVRAEAAKQRVRLAPTNKPRYGGMTVGDRPRKRRAAGNRSAGNQSTSGQPTTGQPTTGQPTTGKPITGKPTKSRAPKPQTPAGADRVARDPELTMRLF